MSWWPRRARSALDPAWRALGLLLILPVAGQVAAGNPLFLGDLDAAAGHAWVAYQLLAMAGLVAGARTLLDGRGRGVALALALAWVAAHVAYDLVLVDSFVRFGERVVIPRPWVFGEAVPMGAWLLGTAVVGGVVEAMRLRERAEASAPAARRVVLLGVATMLRGR